MKFYVYAIYFPTNNKYYVGQTYNIEKRMFEHLHSGSLVCKALYKYDDWQTTILHIVKTRDEANRLEIDHIRNFNSVVPNGYNIVKGGEGNNYWQGKHLSEEHKNKIRKANKGNKKLIKALQGNKCSQGRILSEETKRKISNTLKCHKHSEERKANMKGIGAKIKRLRNKIKKYEQELN